MDKFFASRPAEKLNPADAPFKELKDLTLTNLYNKRPQWLLDVHTVLNQAVVAVKSNRGFLGCARNDVKINVGSLSAFRGQ
jgi:hypothetical protein